MSSLNKAQLIGNLGRDPEVRATQNGSSIATLSIATSESWKDKNSGERVERAEWHRVVILNNDGLCKLVERCLARGSKVYVEGQIRTRKWTDREGVERYATEIHVTPYNGAITFLDSKRDDGDHAPSRQPATARGSTGADLDDDVPFGPCWQ
jgi:single-strand DNA-binding protein